MHVCIPSSHRACESIWVHLPQPPCTLEASKPFLDWTLDPDPEVGKYTAVRPLFWYLFLKNGFFTPMHPWSYLAEIPAALCRGVNWGLPLLLLVCCWKEWIIPANDALWLHRLAFVQIKILVINVYTWDIFVIKSFEKDFKKPHYILQMASLSGDQNAHIHLEKQSYC